MTDGTHVIVLDRFVFVFLVSALESDDRKAQLQMAAKRGAVRELFEETGIDVRDQLERVQPVSLYEEKQDEEQLENEFKSRLFFLVTVTDKDFASDGVSPMGEKGAHLKVGWSTTSS